MRRSAVEAAAAAAAALRARADDGGDARRTANAAHREAHAARRERARKPTAESGAPENSSRLLTAVKSNAFPAVSLGASGFRLPVAHRRPERSSPRIRSGTLEFEPYLESVGIPRRWAPAAVAAAAGYRSWAPPRRISSALAFAGVFLALHGEVQSFLIEEVGNVAVGGLLVGVGAVGAFLAGDADPWAVAVVALALAVAAAALGVCVFLRAPGVRLCAETDHWF